MKSLLPVLFLALLAYGAAQYFDPEKNPSGSAPAVQNTELQNQKIFDAFQHQRSDVQVQGSGTVTRLLPDDLKGSRHQRFILTLSGAPPQRTHTLLVAHNIDLADKILSLKVGDRIDFNGEYEWNPKGGVLHWTHKDPNRRHEDGWLKHAGKLYQ